MPFTDRADIARHEAAHAVVGHEVGGTVNSVDIGGGPRKARVASIAWPILGGIDWIHDATTKPARDAVRKIITCLVAGEVGEKKLKPDLLLLSDRITPEDFATGGNLRSDRYAVVWFLCRILCQDIAEVKAAEERAADVIAAREARMKAVTDKLLEAGYIAGEDLKQALSK